jgi:hypothetical protein
VPPPVPLLPAPPEHPTAVKVTTSIAIASGNASRMRFDPASEPNTPIASSARVVSAITPVERPPPSPPVVAAARRAASAEFGGVVTAVIVKVPGVPGTTVTAVAGAVHVIVALLDAHATITLSLSLAVPPIAEASSEYVAVPPAATVAVVAPLGAAPALKSSPLPISVAVCGAPVALSATEIVADRAPVAPGLNTTLIMHEDAAATLGVQLSVSVKSEAFVPANEMPLTVNAPFPLFVSLIACDVLAWLTS